MLGVRTRIQEAIDDLGVSFIIVGRIRQKRLNLLRSWRHSGQIETHSTYQGFAIRKRCGRDLSRLQFGLNKMIDRIRVAGGLRTNRRQE